MYNFESLFKQRGELCEAIVNRDQKSLESLLVETKMNLNYLDKDGQTPLHRACMIGSLDICRVLIKSGASQDIKNKDGWFPIHLASYYGHFDILVFLLNRNNFRSESIIDVYQDEIAPGVNNYRESGGVFNRATVKAPSSSSGESSSEDEDDEDESDDCKSEEDTSSDHSESLLANCSIDLDDLNLLELKNLDINSNDFS